MIPPRTCAHARALERDLANRYGDAYAAVIIRAGTVRHARQSPPATGPDDAVNARNNGLEDGLLIAATEILRITGLACHRAEHTAQCDIAGMADAIVRDEIEFLLHPTWMQTDSRE